jgi:hypothetical protein
MYGSELQFSIPFIAVHRYDKRMRQMKIRNEFIHASRFYGIIRPP